MAVKLHLSWPSELLLNVIFTLSVGSVVLTIHTSMLAYLKC